MGHRSVLLALLLVPLVLSRCTSTPGTSEGTAPAPILDSFALRLADIDDRLIKAPDDASLYAERSDLFLLHDSLMPAMNDMVRAVSLDSSNADYRVKLGELFWYSRTVDQAKYQFEKALQHEPRNTAALLRLGEIQLVLRQYQASMDRLNEALRIDSRLAKGYFLKGWVHKETGDTAKAISSYFTALEMDPDYFDAVMQLALLHERRDDPLAIEFYDTAIRLRPESSEALYGKGMYCQEHGKDSVALQCYATIIRNDPNNALAYYNSGWVRLEHLDDPRMALADFSAAIEHHPTYHQAFYNRGLAYERLDVLDSAAMNYQRALALLPDYDLAANGLQRLATKGLRIDRPRGAGAAQ
ncbi:MAG: tetratricopeptide repeat protein [Flavobacteriales bacterium]